MCGGGGGGVTDTWYTVGWLKAYGALICGVTLSLVLVHVVMLAGSQCNNIAYTCSHVGILIDRAYMQ